MRKKKTRSNRASERAFLFEVLDNIPVMVAVKEAGTGRFVFANRAAETLWGISRTKVIGKTAKEVFPPAQAQLIDQYDKAALATEGPLILEAHPNIVVSGPTKTVFSKRLAIRDERGSATFLVSLVEDLTKQTVLEQERIADRDFLDKIINNVPSPIIVKDAVSARYVLVNDAAAAFIGLPRNEIIGSLACQVWGSEEVPEIEEQDEKILKDQFPQHLAERTIRTRSKGERIVSRKRLLIRDRNDSPRYILTVLEDVTERRDADQRVLRLAHFDPVTQLPNRTLFIDALTRVICDPTWKSAAILYLDLDQFKHVNDSLGHSAGDELLRLVAARLNACVTNADLVSRLGGDEFAILKISTAEPEDLKTFINRVRNVLIEPLSIEGREISCGASIGIAQFPKDGTTVEDLLKAADLAMYSAKHDGRNTHRFFERPMLTKIAGRRAMQDDLRHAVHAGQLFVEYQPIVRISDLAVSSCEALVRWNHPVRGLIPPSEFIPVAESAGLIDDIGAFVLDTACRRASHWPANIKVAVNVSPMQVRRGMLHRTILSALNLSGLASNRLVLEFTEATLIEEDGMAFSIINLCKEMGIQTALDDFGTGYSSLSYLQRFPFDKIKIDRSFVKNVAQCDVSRSIIRAVTGIATALKSETVAEGVETKVQADLLRILGCIKMQGYLISKPLSASALDHFLSNSLSAQHVA